jgi:glucokinase
MTSTGTRPRVSIGVDVGGTSIKSVVVDSSGTVLDRRRRPSGRDNGPAAVLDAMFAAIDAAVAAVPSDRAGACLGVAVPGVVDDERGLVRWAANLGWRDVPVRALIADRIRWPVWFGHDVHAGGVAEFATGAGRHVTNGAFVPVGTGVSAALLVDGRWHRRDGYAGEIGHLDVGHKEKCRCGQVGCLEVVASASAIARRYTARAHRAVAGSHEVLQRMNSGDRVAAEVWREAVHALGFALSWLVGVLAPQAVVIGGGLAEAGAELLDPLRTDLSGRLGVQRMPELLLARHKDDAACLGAALLAAATAALRPGH